MEQADLEAQLAKKLSEARTTINFDLDPESFGGEDYPSSPEDGIHPMIKEVVSFGPIATPEQEEAINNLYKTQFKINEPNFLRGNGLTDGFDKNAVWIQTYSGRRFNPIAPNPNAIVIQDIAHSLSMQCRFSGHCKKFYSVAQHSVLVSYICDSADALWGLLHDATETYLVDIPRPLKHSGKMENYIEMEKTMQEAVCTRFKLPMKEPASVKLADTKLLATEARDLMSPLHPDWQQPVEPLPFVIESWDQEKAKDMFMKRFFELTGGPTQYEHYLGYKNL